MIRQPSIDGDVMGEEFHEKLMTFLAVLHKYIVLETKSFILLCISTGIALLNYQINRYL